MSIRILPQTADPSRVYPTERLWFVENTGNVFAVMARTSDDAVSDVQFARINPNAFYMSGLHGIPEAYGTCDEFPRTHGEYLGDIEETVVTVFENGTFYLEKGEAMPHICPRCRWPFQPWKTDGDLTCPKCSHEGPPEDFHANMVMSSRPS